MTRNEQIIARRKQGVGPRQIARELGLTAQTVAGVLHRAKLTDSNSAHAQCRIGGGYGPQFHRLVVAHSRAYGIYSAATEWKVGVSAVCKWRRAYPS